MIILSMGFSLALPATFVDLGTAGDFAILSKVQIDSSAGSTTIVGDIGVSPAAHTFVTGFSLIGDETLDTFLTSAQVTGKIYSANLQPPTPTAMTTAISDMALAYSFATDVTANPAGVGPFLDIGFGTVSTQTLTPGVYTWGSAVDITGDLTLDCQGNSSAVFVLQISGDLVLDASKKILLTGSCQNSRVFWAVAGTTDINAGATFEGNLISGPATTEITIITGSVVNGRLLGEKTISLQAGTFVTIPGTMPSAPAVTNDDTSNTLIGITTGMEYNLDNTTYVPYNATNFSLVDLSGDHTLLVRVAAEGLNPAGEATTLTFTTNPATSPSGNSGGGGGSYCSTQWECTEWTTCLNDIQTRECSYREGWCEPEKSEPITSQKCITNIENIEDTEPIVIDTPVNYPTNGAPITGGVTGTGLGYGNGIKEWTFWGWVLAALILGIIVAAIFLIIKSFQK